MDYYAVLGVEPDATTEKIKQAFHKKALQSHPDLNPEGAEAARINFISVKEAYEVLKDPAKKAAYDALRSSGTEQVYNPKQRYGTAWEDSLERAFKEFYEKYGRKFEEEQAPPREPAEKVYADRRAAWEAEKKEAQGNKERMSRLRFRTEDARHAKVSNILRKLWFTHHGLTRQDAIAALFFMMGTAGLVYLWRPIIHGDTCRELREGQAVNDNERGSHSKPL